MDAALLRKLFGQDQHWHGPCTVILDAEDGIQNIGVDSIVSACSKMYAPRRVSGRSPADSVCLLQDGSALLIMQQQRIRQQTGEEIVKQTLTVAATSHLVAVEFYDTAPLLALG